MAADSRIAVGSASDVTLVEEARAGDADAFERLLDARLDRAHHAALAILRNDWDARDPCQDAFVAAWRKLPRLRQPARFDAWLDRIVVNQRRTLLRARRARAQARVDRRSSRNPVAGRPAGGRTAEAYARRERKTPHVSFGIPLGWPQRSGGQAPEADALSTELQARGTDHTAQARIDRRLMVPPRIPDAKTSRRAPSPGLGTTGGSCG
jgi:RNA polymerase sigma factor (sigma-70 family)